MSDWLDVWPFRRAVAREFGGGGFPALSEKYDIIGLWR